MNITPELKEAIVTIFAFAASMDDRNKTLAVADSTENLWIRVTLRAIENGSAPDDAAAVGDDFVTEWRKRFGAPQDILAVVHPIGKGD